MRICRAEDGVQFEVSETLSEVQRAGNLYHRLHTITGVPLECIVAYLPDGRLFPESGLPESSISAQESIFVFNKQFLDLEVEDIFEKLSTNPTYAPIFDDAALSTSSLSSELMTWMTQLIDTLNNQLEALRIASSNLDLNLLTISDTYEAFADSAQVELRAQEELLNNIDFDLEIISKIKIHPEFLSPAARRNQEKGERSRTLGDYVSTSKMKQVADNCAILHADLRTRFTAIHDTFQSIMTGSGKIRQTSASLSAPTEASGCVNRVRSSFERLASGEDAAVHQQAVQREIQQICQLKNSVTEYCIHSLREISFYNADLLELPRTLSVLQADFRARNSFTHIQRLHSMLYAYGATLIEVVRRQEFSGFFYQRANRIAEMLAKLTAAEKKRRQIYRSDVQGFMPFEVRSMEQLVPSVEMNVASASISQVSIGRPDIEAFFEEVDRIGRSIQSLSESSSRDRNPMREAREMWLNIISRMDNLENTFDRAAERALLSSSRIIKRSAVFEHPSYLETTQRLEELQHVHSDMQTHFDDHRKSLEDEIDRLRGQCEDLTESLSCARGKIEIIGQEKDSSQAELDHLHHLQMISERHISQLTTDNESLRKALDEAIQADRTKTREADKLRVELTQVQSEHQELKRLEEHNAARLAALFNDQQTTLRNLEEARSRGENLESQIQAALAEGKDAKRALDEANEEKERLLRTQAGEHDRRLRDQIAEADGDRAVWEHQFSALRTELESTRNALEIANADLSGQREEYERTVHDLREARRREAALRGDFDNARSAFSEHETRSARDERLVAEILQVAINYRQALTKAVSVAQSASLYPTKAQQTGLGLAESVLSVTAHSNAVGRPGTFLTTVHGNTGPNLLPNSPEDLPSIDASDPEQALEALRELDLDACFDVVSKPASALRKWQKQCKDYRERAKGKITFRNFSKGDLALFLPIKNSVQKPWAAFNMAFPHYFLQPTGAIADQLKSREWIVARITSITEKIANSQEPGSNPFNLNDGIKYYMCQVEDWTQPSGGGTGGGKQRNNSATLLSGTTVKSVQSSPIVEKGQQGSHSHNDDTNVAASSSNPNKESPSRNRDRESDRKGADAGANVDAGVVDAHSNGHDARLGPAPGTGTTNIDESTDAHANAQSSNTLSMGNDDEKPNRSDGGPQTITQSGDFGLQTHGHQAPGQALISVIPSTSVSGSGSGSGNGSVNGHPYPAGNIDDTTIPDLETRVNDLQLDPPPSSHLFPFASRGRTAGRRIGNGSGGAVGPGSPGRSSLSKMLALAASGEIGETSPEEQDADRKEGSSAAILASPTMTSNAPTVVEPRQASPTPETPTFKVPPPPTPHRDSGRSSKSPTSPKSPRSPRPSHHLTSRPSSSGSGSASRSHKSRTSSSSTYAGPGPAALAGRTKLAPSPLGMPGSPKTSSKAIATIALSKDIVATPGATSGSSTPGRVAMQSTSSLDLTATQSQREVRIPGQVISEREAPSPAGSASEGILNALYASERRRTTSTGGGRPNPFRSLASSLGLPFGVRERKVSSSSVRENAEVASGGSAREGEGRGRRRSVGYRGGDRASELLRQLERGS